MLFRNNGNGTFADVTAKAGLGAGGWSTSAALADYDHDGRLDLFVASYIDFDLATAPLPGARVPGVNCLYRGFPVMCGPRGLKGARDVLSHNNGNGTFTDVTEQAGIDRTAPAASASSGATTTTTAGPICSSPTTRSPICSTATSGDGTFDEVALTAGVAVDEDGRERAGMGIDFGDYDNDGWLDARDRQLLRRAERALSEPARRDVRRDDLAVRHRPADHAGADLGHAVLRLRQRRLEGSPVRERPRLPGSGRASPRRDLRAARAPLPQQRQRHLRERRRRPPASVWEHRWAGRGAAFGDYDNDGDLDIAIAIVNGPPVLLQNRGGEAAHSVTVTLVGSQSNRDAIGARVTVTVTGGRSSRRSAAEGAIFRRAIFGSISVLAASAVSRPWTSRGPAGGKSRLGPIEAGTFVTIKEGSGVVSTGQRR